MKMNHYNMTEKINSTCQTTPTHRICWINCAKFMAIMAVMVDHTAGTLYYNSNIQKMSFYSVSLFIIISGMLCYRSNERQCLPYLKTIQKSLSKILPAYLVATFVYQIFIHRYFDFFTYIKYLIGFNVSAPFYFVLLYIQLMFVNRILFTILYKNCKRYSWIKDVALGGYLYV